MNKLTDGEYEIVKGFLNSPAYHILKKISRQHRENVMETLLQESDPIKIYRAQGQCQDLSFFERLADILVSYHEGAKEAELERKVQSQLCDPSLLPQHQIRTKNVKNG